MTPILQPVVKSILVCQEVLRDNRGNLHLLGVFERIRRSHSGEPTPQYSYPQLCFVVAVTDVVGNFSARVRVTSASTDAVVFSSSTETVSIHDKLNVKWVVFRLRNCPLPVAGVNFFQLHWNGHVLAEFRIPVVD